MKETILDVLLYLFVTLLGPHLPPLLRFPAGGSGTPTKAVSCHAGREKSLQAAAVMMPSVPSAPMKRFFRS